MLRFLSTDEAVDELIERYADGEPGCGFESLAGLFGAPNRGRVAQQMEAGLLASDQPVTMSYVRTPAVLSVQLRHPELRPAIPEAQRRANAIRANKADPIGSALQAIELARYQDVIRAAEANYEDILAAALPEKAEGARAVTLANRFQSSRPRAVTAASPDRDRDQLASTFLELPADQQRMLLDYQWRRLGGPGLVPVLHRLVQSALSAWTPLADLGLRRLYQMNAEDGRGLILQQIQDPPRWASLATLGVLPEEELPDLDDVLATNLETTEDYDALTIRAELLHRYASARVAHRVAAWFDDRLAPMACRPQAALLSYFLRVDEELGKTKLDRALAARTITGCHRFVLGAVAALRMTPAVEAAAIAHLDDLDPQVVVSAIETLRRHGSSRAYQPLHAHFERWHSAWQGRESDLRFDRAVERPHAAQALVESAFFVALAEGQEWLTGMRDLEELRALCVTEGCRTQADHRLSSAEEAGITIFSLDDPENAVIRLAQYQLTSLSALEKKLAQYPKGTAFTLDVSPLDPQAAAAVRSEITALAEDRGLTIRQ